MGSIKGPAIAVAGVGAVFAYSGIKGISVTQSLQWILTGKNPETLSQTTGIGIPADNSAATSAGSSGGAALNPGLNANAKQIAQAMLGQFGWSQNEFAPLDTLWTNESGWNVSATNPSSGAYGIPQSLPASKMASAGADWKTNAATQIRWGLGYIKATYGSPTAALAAWESRSPHWY